MDKLSLRFAQEAAVRQIDDCSDLGELKALATSLVKGHFEAKALIELLLLQGLPTYRDGSWVTSMDDGAR